MRSRTEADLVSISCLLRIVSNKHENQVQEKHTRGLFRKSKVPQHLSHKLDKLEELDEDKNYKWDGLKQLRKKFTPKNTKFKDKHG